MNKFQAKAASIVGEEMAAELAIRATKPHPIVLAKEVEISVLEKCMAAFECEYCGNGFAVDLHKETARCPGCSAYVPYETIMLAISPIQFKMEYEGHFNPVSAGLLPGTGSYSYPDPNRYGTVIEHRLCRVDGTAPAVSGSDLCKYHGGLINGRNP